MLANMMLATVAWAAISQPSAAPSRYQADLAQLLDLGMHASARALAGARALHDRLGEQPEYGARTEFAFALVLVQQRRCGDAVDILKNVVATDPKSLPAWRTLLWAALASRRDRDAMIALRQVAELAAAATAKQRGETAFFLGQVFGYLEGPRAGTVTEEELRKARQKSLGLLGDERKQFAAGEEAFTARFAHLNERLREAEDSDAAAQTQKIALLKVRQKSVNEAKVENEFKTEKLKNDLHSELEFLEQRVQLVRTAITKNQYRAKQVEAAIITQQTRAQVLNSVNSGSSGGALPLVQARLQLNAIQQDLALLSTQQLANLEDLAVNQANLASLLQRQANLLGEKQQESSELRTQVVRIGNSEKQLLAAQKLESRRANPASRESRVLRDRIQAFSTYVAFPFERERQIVLNWADSGSAAKPKRSAATDATGSTATPTPNGAGQENINTSP